MPLDLTPFGFTPTESLVYGVLVTGGPGTGYAIARGAGLARANAYSALEGLVGKGAARRDDGRPRRYRPEPPTVLLGRIVDQQSRAVDELSRALGEISVPATPTLTEITSLRSLKQTLLLEMGRAREGILAFLPSEAWPALGPAVRRASGAGLRLELHADGAVEGLGGVVSERTLAGDWPGRPLVAAIDGRVALIGSAEGAEGEDRVTGNLGTAPFLVAAATIAVRALAGQG
jgi:sugar-specific transcriptional regulator TrmB